MATAQDVLDEIQQYFPNVSENRRLEVLQQVHDELLMKYAIRWETETNTSLTATDREYAIPAGVIKFKEVVYYKTATDARVLEAVSYDKLRDENPDHYLSTLTGPRRYYELAGNIGLDKLPDSASAGSPAYPRLVMTVRKLETLSTSTTMPSTAPNHKAWVTKVCLELAAQNEDSRVGMFADLAKTHEAMLAMYIEGKVPDAPHQLVPPPTGRKRTSRG